MDEREKKTLERHGWKLNELEGMLKRRDASFMEITRDVSDVKNKQQIDHEAFTKYIAVAEAATRAAEKAAEKAVTAKQLYISFALAVIALATLLQVHP